MDNQVRVVSAAFACSGFAAACIAGLAAGSSPERVILRAIAALIVCQIVGTLAGTALSRIVAEHDEKYRKAHPIPEVPEPPSRRAAPIIVDEAPDESVGGASAVS